MLVARVRKFLWLTGAVGATFSLPPGGIAPAATLRAAGSPAVVREVAPLVERVRTKVVLIDVRFGRGGRAGTGFFAAPGRVLTSEHVIRDAKRITVWANGVPYRARILASDPALDLALLTLPDAALLIKPLALAEPGSTSPGEPILIVGTHPAPTVATAQHSLISGQFRGPSWFQWPPHRFSRALDLSAHVEPGDSGSPVLRVRDGAVIGVVRARDLPGSAGRSLRAWAVPIEDASPLLGRAGGLTYRATRPDPDREFYLHRP